MASVHKNPGSPCWNASVRIWIPMVDHPDGGYWKRSRRSTGIPLDKPKSEAKLIANEIERACNEVRKGKSVDARKFYQGSVRRMMLAAGIEEELKEISWEKWSKQWLYERQCAKRSIEKYTTDIRKFDRHLGARKTTELRLITHTDIQAFYMAMRDSGHSGVTARLVIKNVKSCLKRAMAHGFIERNPAELVEMDTAVVQNKKPFPLEDVKLIFEQLRKEKEFGEEWVMACRFALMYGMRLRDAIKRSFDEIHSEKGLRVIRFIPLKKKRRGSVVSLPLVSPIDKLRGTGLITPNLSKMGNPSKVFSRILKSAGVEVVITKGVGKGRNTSDKSFHSWRHTCNTIMSNVGVDIRIRQLVCDHDSETMNSKYTHPALESMAGAVGLVMKEVGF